MLYISLAVCVILAFSFGRHLEKTRKITNETISNLNGIIKYLLQHSENQQQVWQSIVSIKDGVIKSLTEENALIKNQLENFEEVFSEDEDESEAVGVLANGTPAKNKLAVFNSTRSAADTALELHDQIINSRKMLDAFKDKIDADVYKHLKVALGECSEKDLTVN